MREDFRHKVYEQFSQVDGSSTRKHGGTGLGLAISKALTEGMGGELDFHSKPGDGVTFYLWFAKVG